jgi:hypothetical protein
MKFGSAIRKAAGKDRLRILQLVDRYPTDEFVGEGVELRAARKKWPASTRTERASNCPSGQQFHPSIRDCRSGLTGDVVVGPNASNGLAVICKSDDILSMATYALVRYTYRQERA